MEVRMKMFDRRFIGDVTIAVLIAVPSGALARQGAVAHRDEPVVQKSEFALAPAADRQIGLYR
jgi:hypothetical protein